MTDPAPRRKKPWYRVRNVLLFCLALCLLIIGWMVWETFALMRQEPNPDTDYRAEHHDRVRALFGIPEDHGEEEWQLLLELLTIAQSAQAEVEMEITALDQAGEWKSRYPYDGPYLDFTYLTSGPSIPDDATWERRAIDKLREQGVFDMLDEFAASAPGLDTRPVGGPFMQQLLPELSQARRLAQALTASMRIALVEEDWATFGRSFDRAMAMAQTMALQHTLISYLVGVAIETLMLNHLHYAMIDADLPAETCRAILDSFEKRRLPPVSLAIQAEQTMFHDTMQWYYSDDGNGDGYLLPDSTLMMGGWGMPDMPGGFAGAAIARFVLAGRRETVERYDTMIERILERATTSPVERAPEVEMNVEELGHLERVRYMIVDMLTPAVDSTVTSSTIASVMEAGARVAAGIELFHALNGRYPQTLDDLVPQVFDELPADPIHGGSFAYRLFETPDEHGRHFLLYSTGLDETDNGGVEPGTAEHPDYFAALRDRDGDGYDSVVNRPRPTLDD